MEIVRFTSSKTIQCNTMLLKCPFSFVNKAAGLKTFYWLPNHLLSCIYLITSLKMYWLSQISINIDNPNSKIATLKRVSCTTINEYIYNRLASVNY